jgi:hypothetical protein
MRRFCLCVCVCIWFMVLVGSSSREGKLVPMDWMPWDCLYACSDARRSLSGSKLPLKYGGLGIRPVPFYESLDSGLGGGRAFYRGRKSIAPGGELWFFWCTCVHAIDPTVSLVLSIDVSCGSCSIRRPGRRVPVARVPGVWLPTDYHLVRLGAVCCRRT